MSDANTIGPETKANADLESRRHAYDEWTVWETVAHETMDHRFEPDPFNEQDVEGHMPRRGKC